MITDDEIRRMAGHPDAIPPQYIEWFLKGYRQCETQQQVKNLNIPAVMVELPENHVCRYSKAMNQPYPRLCVDCGKPEGN